MAMCGIKRAWEYLCHAEWVFFALAFLISLAYVVQNALAYGILLCQALLDQGRNAYILLLIQIHMFLIIVCGFIGGALIVINLRFWEYFRSPTTERNLGTRRFKMQAWTWLYFALCHIYGFKLMMRVVEMVFWWTNAVTGTEYEVREGRELDKCLARTSAQSIRLNETMVRYQWKPVYTYFKNYSLMMTSYEALHLILVMLMARYAWQKYARQIGPRLTPPIVETTISEM